MKRLITILVFVSISLVVGGCAFDKYTLISIRGADIKAPLGSFTPIEGKDLKGFVLRRVFWTNEKGRQPAPIDRVIVTEDADSSGSAEINK